MADITFWEEVIAENVIRMDLSCSRCGHLNILVKGENLNCEGCGEQLLEFAPQEKAE